MSSFYDPRQPWFTLRRDFADELGFGEYLLRLDEGAPIDNARREANARMALSPMLPRYVAYFTSGSNACITVDFEHYHVIDARFFDSMVAALVESIRRSVLLLGGAQGPSGPASISASKEGFPEYVVVHDTHTAGAYYWPANDATVQFLREQPQ
jgi:hypothetical protein